MFVGTVANASNLENVVSGSVGTGLSYTYVEMFAPERDDLKKHAFIGGLISTVIGVVDEYSNGWKGAAVAGLGKELVYDGLLGLGTVQLDDFLVTSASGLMVSVFQERKLKPELLSRDGELRIGFKYSFKF